MPKQEINREAWLTDAAQMLCTDLLEPICGNRNRPNFRISMSDASATKKKLAWMHPTHNSTTETVNEIFVAATADSTKDILGYILHELIHCYDNHASGHRGFFERTALQLGFARPLDAYTPSETLTDLLQDYCDELGQIPHDALKQAKKQTGQNNRHIPVICTNNQCGFKFTTSNAWLSKIDFDECECPVCYQVTMRRVHAN